MSEISELWVLHNPKVSPATSAHSVLETAAAPGAAQLELVLTDATRWDTPLRWVQEYTLRKHKSPLRAKLERAAALFCVRDPNGIRTRVTAVRGRRTRPLYDGASLQLDEYAIPRRARPNRAPAPVARQHTMPKSNKRSTGATINSSRFGLLFTQRTS